MIFLEWLNHSGRISLPSNNLVIYQSLRAFLHLIDQKSGYDEGLGAIEVATFSRSEFAFTLHYTLK